MYPEAQILVWATSSRSQTLHGHIAIPLVRPAENSCFLAPSLPGSKYHKRENIKTIKLFYNDAAWRLRNRPSCWDHIALVKTSCPPEAGNNLFITLKGRWLRQPSSLVGSRLASYPQSWDSFSVPASVSVEFTCSPCVAWGLYYHPNLYT